MLFNDSEFRALPARAQRLLIWLWLHPDLTMAGTISIQRTEWANAADGLSEDDVKEDAAVLRRAGWVDYDEGQLWLRPFMQLDGALKGGPQRYISAARAVMTIRSRRLRQAVAAMFTGLPVPVREVPPDAEKAAKVMAMNTAVERAVMELTASVAAVGVLASLESPDTPSDTASHAPSIPHRIPTVVGVAVDVCEGEPKRCARCSGVVEAERRTEATWRPDLCASCADAAKHASMRATPAWTTT
ncbi:hypothetical protein [Mycobacterium sp. UM_Kg1]|uniref:hypothetical protein n=1 Tax=Mycobacterium sp. UM_Kg1 TaxID=1545691 RepID=UPI00128BF897|nr:hypothetical protein [Mycobacterium sp. UM_Kg1]